MNKKILFFILFLLVSVLPVVASALTALDDILIKIQDMFITLGGTIVVIGWIITGILYLTAAGSPEKIGTAKKALVACVIGTAVIILATTAQSILESYLK
ncbi:MAG: hypothetical protein HY005_03350 [Candidatus Staskawiczbacteria bacterium]|nr:hypothetical protein [Candidatus Staskawiczbacteria bacterium]MBI3337625.1 hypothetical protein [Candidatus Staskawiczbacteria bacterium]